MGRAPPAAAASAPRAPFSASPSQQATLTNAANYVPPMTKVQQIASPDPRYTSYPQSSMPTYTSTFDQVPGMSAPQAQAYRAPEPMYVTPQMWQNAVATAFGGGSKRRWNEGVNALQAKRQR